MRSSMRVYTIVQLFDCMQCSKQENVVDIILQSLCSGDDHQNVFCLF